MKKLVMYENKRNWISIVFLELGNKLLITSRDFYDFMNCLIICIQISRQAKYELNLTKIR